MQDSRSWVDDIIGIHKYEKGGILERKQSRAWGIEIRIPWSCQAWHTSWLFRPCAGSCTIPSPQLRRRNHHMFTYLQAFYLYVCSRETLH